MCEKSVFSKVIWCGITVVAVLHLCMSIGTAETASYYTVDSCRREGTSGIMANGEVLNDEAFTCASWDYPFGTSLRIRNKENGKSVVVTVTDRGPNRRLYRQGRTIDLSKRAFSEIANIKQGVIEIEVEVVK